MDTIKLGAICVVASAAEREVPVRSIAICFALVLICFFSARPLSAQAADGAVTKLASASDIQALAAKAKAQHKPGDPNTIESIIALAPYNVNLEYRTGVGPAAVHEHEAELFVVLDGTGTVVTGGKLTGGKRVDAANWQGTGVDAGTARAVAKGDVIFVPENTPHWYSQVNGTLVLMSMHVPRPVPAPAAH